MSELLNKTQFPVYEVGEPDENSDPNYRVTRYEAAHMTNPASFGMPVVRTKDIKYGPGQKEDTRVPTSTLRASQNYVYGPHVRNLATIPQQSFDSVHGYDPVSVVRQPDGTHVVTEGHHRAAAAILRGDKDLRVNAHVPKAD